ncbi:urea transporter [Pseudomonas lundensis]|uniref:urea transporter n=1 Tax=Pseudomonas lundensis TaxID=86185 RepID=UPI001891D3E4|nr:urea transporter [Pseudomonas lundensis]QOF90969.1 urea transporter [Pseudomonas lundensis]
MHAPSFSQPCPDWATALCNGFSQIFLQRHPLCGVLCLLAILVSAPSLLGGALLGGVSGLLTAQRRGYPKAERQAGLYSYNGVLLGLLLSHQLPWSAMLPLLIIASAGLSTMLVHQWLKRASNGNTLMAYTAPFVGLGWLLLSFNPAPPASAWPPPELNGLTLAQGLLTGIGQVMLLQSPLAGLLIVTGLWLSSRRAALWALTGALAGVGFSLLQHDPATALSGLGGYNAALAALALCQRTRHPWQPLAGILLALMLTPGFSALGLPALTAPFILSSWLVLASVRLLTPSSVQSRLRIER